jgi:hypothetical protein
MEQTAVEWLEDCFNRYGAVLKSDFIKAKKMFEQQITDTYETAYMDGYYDIGKLGAQYYNEKFNK